MVNGWIFGEINMKALLISGLLAVVLGGVAFNQAVSTPAIGQSCDKDPVYVIDTFTVTPYPIAQAQQYLISIGGKFSEKDYIEQIYIATKDGKGFWHYSYQTVKKEYSKNAIANFTVSLEGPSERGAYTDQISFHRHDFSYLACWQYDYDIK